MKGKKKGGRTLASAAGERHSTRCGRRCSRALGLVFGRLVVVDIRKLAQLAGGLLGCQVALGLCVHLVADLYVSVNGRAGVEEAGQ